MYNANNVYRNTTPSYETLALQYIVYASVLDFECWFEFAKSNDKYINERFMIMFMLMGSSDEDDMGGYVIVYDFKAMSGTFFYYSGKTNYDYRIAKLTGNAGNVLYISGSYADTHYNGHTFAGVDDPLAELSYIGIKYFDIINDGDDETVLSQLNASLMKLSKIMNL